MDEGVKHTQYIFPNFENIIDWLFLASVFGVNKVTKPCTAEANDLIIWYQGLRGHMRVTALSPSKI